MDSSSTFAFLVRSQLCESLGMLTQAENLQQPFICWLDAKSCQVNLSCTYFQGNFALQFKSKIKQIKHFKHLVERIKHLFTYRYIRKQFLSIKRTLQINMKHHTFIILVIQNTFLSQPHCTTLDNKNLKKPDKPNASDSQWFTVWRFANTYTLPKDSTTPATPDQWPDQL